MASAPIRDQVGDHLITPQNAALVLIDYQPSQIATFRSMDRAPAVKNIVSTVKAARAFGLPIVHSTVNVASGQQQPTVPSWPSCPTTPPDRPHQRQLVGRHRLRGRSACHRPAQAHLLRAVDRGLPHVPHARRHAGGLRGLSRGRRDRRHIRGGAPRRHRACRPGRRPSRSAGSCSRASYSATGTAWRRCRRSSRSCSPRGC